MFTQRFPSHLFITHDRIWMMFDNVLNNMVDAEYTRTHTKPLSVEFK